MSSYQLLEERYWLNAAKRVISKVPEYEHKAFTEWIQANDRLYLYEKSEAHRDALVNAFMDTRIEPCMRVAEGL
mgnify:CR=1 FL=1